MIEFIIEALLTKLRMDFLNEVIDDSSFWAMSHKGSGMAKVSPPSVLPLNRSKVPYFLLVQIP